MLSEMSPFVQAAEVKPATYDSNPGQPIEHILIPLRT